MPEQPVASPVQKKPIRAKHALWALFALMTLFVLLTRDRTLLDPTSFLRQRYAPVQVLMFAHGIPGALALLLGFFQFSNGLRQRHLQLHRVLGRIYIACAVISAPVAIAVAIKLPMPTLLMASIIQAAGWLIATGTALYCVRLGKIQQHKEWMLRGYPFAMVFVVVRVILAIPAVGRMGLFGVVTVVWSVLATAAFLPSFLIAWQALATGSRSGRKNQEPQNVPG